MQPIRLPYFIVLATLLVFSSHAYCQGMAQQALSIERIFSAPALDTAAPTQLKFSPDETLLTYLKGSEQAPDVLDLWGYDLKTQQHRLLLAATELVADVTAMSAAERARRERLRIRNSGIVDYQWSPQGDALLIPIAGQLFLYRLNTDSETSALQTLTTPEQQATDARFSPQGRYISFIESGNLWAFDTAQNKQIQLTIGASRKISYGVAEFVAQEEMKRMTGYWWASDEQHIALTRVDVRPVGVKTRVDIYADRSELVKQRYPAAGEANADVDLGVLKLDDRGIDWLELGQRYGDGYLARVNWVPQRNILTYQWQNRSQSELTLWQYDLATAEHQRILQETSDYWINLHDDLHFLSNSPHFIWASARSGYKHLYLYRLDGTLIRQLTSGEWQVDQLEAVDETAGLFYFSGRKDSPIERHLYRSSLATKTPSQPTRLSQRDGYHQFTFSRSAQAYVSYFSNTQQPPQVSLHGPSGERLTWIHENRITPEHPLSPYIDNFATSQFGELQAADGQSLYYQLTTPKVIADNKRYPAIVLVYGGPRAQRVLNRWGSYFTQYLVQQGYVVFQLDNRGSGNRGNRFEQGIYRQLSQLEVADQRIGAEFLRSLPYIDPERIGVFGHSYGGYMALHLILRADDLFSAAVAGAPVTDWALYDTHYTERYMGTPENNPEGYQAANVMTYANQLQRPLLIYHGMADDNVLYSHTAMLSYALQQAMLPFELMAYPGKQHGLRGRETSIHRYQLIADFFDRHLR